MKITHIVFDLDGVLTDGRQHIDADGKKQFKTVHCRDKTAIKRLIDAGLKVVVLTMDDWPGAFTWFQEMGCTVIYTREKEGENLPWDKCLGIGDDITDIPFLSRCELSACPKDAHPALLQVVDKVIDVNGGGGVASMVEWILLSGMIGHWMDHVNYIIRNDQTN